MTRLKKEIQNGFITFSTHHNSPSASILEVLKETQKAVYVKHEETKKSVWLPKSSLEEIDLTKETNYPAFTLSKRFRMYLKKRYEDYPFYALGVIS